MDFELKEEQTLLRDMVSRFFTDTLPFEKRQEIITSSPGYSSSQWSALADLGVLSLPLSEDAGGLGGSAVDTMLIMEQMGRALFTGPYVGTVLLAARLLEWADGSEQATSVLEEAMQGRSTLAFAYAEREAGYEITGAGLWAEPDGDGFRLNGAKCAVFHADTADRLVVLARTAGQAGRTAGLSLFLVPCDAPGVSMVAYGTQDGARAADVAFSDVIVARADVIGRVGDMHDAVACVLDQATAALIAEASGIMWAVYELTLDYMKTRSQFGVTLGSFQALQHRMVDIYMMCEMAQSMAVAAAVACDSESPVQRRLAVSAAKSLIGRYGRKVGQEGIQLHGGIGMTMDVPVGHYFKRLCMIDASFGDVAWHEARHALEGTKPASLSTTLSSSLSEP